jgi:hypothetical protein
MAENWRNMLTPSGSPNAEYRQKYSILPGGRFPVAPGDNERGRAAIRLRGNGTTKAERRKILATVARRCPDLKKVIAAAREADQKAGAI